jgi:predicted nucleic acid-binding protein
MGHLSFLSNREEPLVLDASGIINLCASAASIGVLRALARPIFVVREAANEVTLDRRSGRDDRTLLAALVTAGLVEIVTLDEDALDRFASLTIGPAADTLDDGEAATIAFASSRGFISVVDERKALELCARQEPTMLVASTVDIFAHQAVQAALGAIRLGEALHNALALARMRVLPRHLGWVLDLVGPERAATCPSLPKSARPTIVG